MMNREHIKNEIDSLPDFVIAYSAEIGHRDRRTLYTMTGETVHPFRRD